MKKLFYEGLPQAKKLACDLYVKLIISSSLLANLIPLTRISRYTSCNKCLNRNSNTKTNINLLQTAINRYITNSTEHSIQWSSISLLARRSENILKRKIMFVKRYFSVEFFLSIFFSIEFMNLWTGSYLKNDSKTLQFRSVAFVRTSCSLTSDINY